MELVIVEVGHSDTDDTSVLHIPVLGLVVAGDVICNGGHLYLGESVLVGGFGPWREAIAKVEALEPRHIVCGHQKLLTENTAVDFFNAKLERYPNHLGRKVLWAGASALYGVSEHPDQEVGQILVAGWL